MRILNFGSLNIDHVYRVSHTVRPGETLGSTGLEYFAGGKGLNQSCALGRARATVLHAGKVGEDGRWLLETLNQAGVDTTHTVVGEGPTGHAIIQVDERGENAIVLFGGGNTDLTRGEVDAALAAFGEGDLLLLQNEVNEIPYLMRAASKRGMRVAFNPAPFAPAVMDYPLDLVDMLVVNETEGQGMSGMEAPEAIFDSLCGRYPEMHIVLTLGGDGAAYRGPEGACRVAAEAVTVVDTTAAGDTFIGYLLAGRAEGMAMEASLALGCRAAAIAVSRPGAAESVPLRAEVMASPL
ncbi:MAG: ribokinase [Planctomycetota bacterium]|jgi:ribokinase